MAFFSKFINFNSKIKKFYGTSNKVPTRFRFPLINICALTPLVTIQKEISEEYKYKKEFDLYNINKGIGIQAKQLLWVGEYIVSITRKGLESPYFGSEPYNVTIYKARDYVNNEGCLYYCKKECEVESVILTYPKYGVEDLNSLLRELYTKHSKYSGDKLLLKKSLEESIAKISHEKHNRNSSQPLL